jgi:hypothetical protein
VTWEALQFLLSPEGEAAILEASAGSDTLATLERLRMRLSPENASAAVKMAELRRKGQAKFARADRMLFAPAGLEMATGERIARWRARRFEGCARVADLTCGIGGDSIALAGVAETIAEERDLVALRMARRNAEVYGVGRSLLPVCADSRAWRPEADALFIDPARRIDGRRLRSGDDLQPPLGEALAWACAAKRAGIKLSPAFDWEPFAGEAEVELISDGGECREAVFWLGEAKTCRVRASLADRGVSLIDRPSEPAPVRAVGAYLYEPDPAVRRARLIDPLAEEIGAWKLEPEIAYLSSDSAVSTPFARLYAVEEIFPFSLKELQRRLRRAGAGRAIVKKRGVAYDPAEIERRLKLDGDATATVALTRIRGRATAMLIRPLDREMREGGAAASEI